jgi:predicted nucleotidyltransferase
MATTLGTIQEGVGIVQAPSRNELKRLYNEAASHAASIVRREYPQLAGILVHGSVARGEPGPFSDIDMLAVTNRNRKPSGFSYFDGDIYVGVGFMSVAELEKEFAEPKAFFWARGSAKATRILYDPKGILRRIMLRWKKAKPTNQILEKSLWDDYHNIIEYSGQVEERLAQAG